MDPLVLREIESQLSLDTKLLLQMLGESHSLGASVGTSRDGSKILENAKRVLAEDICINKGVRAVYSTAENSTVQLVAAVLDCIAGYVTGISPITVSVLIVKQGVGKLCAEAWRNET